MANGIDVNIGADTNEFARSVKSGMQQPVEDAQGALEDYVRVAEDSGSDLSRTFEAQQRSTLDLKGDIDKLNQSISEGSRPAYQRAGAEADTFKRRSTEGFEEVRNSAKSNAIEVGASFTGGFDQAVGGLQGFIAEFLAGFGPAGLIAGVGAAALLGTVTAAIDSGQQAAEAQKAAVAALAGEYLDAGRTGSRTFDNVATAIKSMATSDGSDVIITLQQAFDAAAASGADYQDVVQAIASGSPAEIGRAQRAVEALASAHRHAQDTSLSAARGAVADNQRQVAANEKLRDSLAKAEQQAEDAGRAEKLAARAGLTDLSLKKDLLEQLQGGYDDAAGGVDDYLNKERTVLKVGPYLESIKKRRDALVEYKKTLDESDLSAAAKKFIEGQGAEAAAAALAGYKNASPRQKAELNEVWSTAGDSSADSYGAALGTNLSKIKPKAPAIPRPVVPAPDTSALQRFFATRQPRLQIGVDLVARNGQRIG